MRSFCVSSVFTMMWMTRIALVRIVSKTKKQKLRTWSKSRRRSQDCLQLTGTSLFWENHLCCVIELFELWIPKPTSFPSRCFAWEATVQNEFKLGKTKIKRYLETCYLKELDRIDGEQMEFEWTNFPGFTTLGILNEIQKMMTEIQCEPGQFQGRIIFMSMFNDIIWWSPGNENHWRANSLNVATYAKGFPVWCWWAGHI